MFTLAHALLMGQGRAPEVGYGWTVGNNYSSSSYQTPSSWPEVLAEVSLNSDGTVDWSYDQALSTSVGISTIRARGDAMWWAEVDPTIGDKKEVRISKESGGAPLLLRDGYTLDTWLSLSVARSFYISLGAGYGSFGASVKVEFRDANFPGIIEETHYVGLNASRVMP